MNMALGPFCGYCGLQNTGIHPVSCPEEDTIHILEDCPSFTLLHIGHFEVFKTNLEDILNQKLTLTTIFKRFAKSCKSVASPKNQNLE